MIDLSKKKRIVIKVGTSTLAHATGNLNLRRVERLLRVFSDLINSGREIVFVTSGAVGVGVGRTGLLEKPCDMPAKQACAAIGQCALMNIYDSEFSKYGHKPAQILITRDVVSNPERKQNVKNTFRKLFEMRAVPVINANDSVSIENLDFDENDTLSAIVAQLSEADLLVILTDVDGLYDRNPVLPGAKLIRQAGKVTEEMIFSAREKNSPLSSGGMLTKLEAAVIATESGIPTVIMNGENPDILYDLFENKAMCTVFESI